MDQWHHTVGSESFYIDSLVEPCFERKQMGFIACNVLKLLNLLIFRKKAFAYSFAFSLGSFRINSLKKTVSLWADGFHRLKGWRLLAYPKWNQTQTSRLYKQLYVKVNSPSEFYFAAPKEENDTFAFQFEFFLKLLLYLLRKTPLWCSLFSCFSKKSKKTNKY